MSKPMGYGKTWSCAWCDRGHTCKYSQSKQARETLRKPKPYKPSRLFLETLEGYVEAAKVKLLTEFTENAER